MQSELKIDKKWNSRARPVYRVFGFFLGIVLLVFGAMGLVDKWATDSFKMNSSLMFDIAAIGYGIVFLIVAFRGRLLKRDIG